MPEKQDIGAAVNSRRLVRYIEIELQLEKLATAAMLIRDRTSFGVHKKETITGCLEAIRANLSLLRNDEPPPIGPPY
jgi:hypothetical protein